MKKLIILSIFLLIGIKGYSETPDSTKITVKEVYNDAKKVLSELGSALKIGSEHVYEVLVKQQLVNSITNIVVYGVFLLVFLAIALILNKGFKEDSDSERLTVMCVISVIVFLIFFITFIFTVAETITGFVNPEYGAIKQIMELIKK